jgi:hypothetical protein
MANRRAGAGWTIFHITSPALVAAGAKAMINQLFPNVGDFTTVCWNANRRLMQT